MRFNFTDKNVVVTGASRGIGYGIAEGFCRAGANVTILAETDEVFLASERLSGICGRTVNAILCDISDVAQVREAFKSIAKIDVLINNAGLELITPIQDESEQVEFDFKRIIDINVMGTFYVTRYALEKMAPGSTIAITCSIWSRTAVAEFSAYCASKHATLGFMRSMSKELAPKGIRVNAVCPGWVKTISSMRSLKVMSERTGVPQDQMLEDILKSQSLEGLMEPEDVVDTYLYLSSDLAKNITGQAINVDRGEVLS